MPDVVMPRLSDSMEEGTILKWLKAEGDEVARGDELVEIETDKATMTYEADTAGTLAIVAQEGDTLPIGEVIARIGAGGEAPASDGAPAEATQQAEASGNGGPSEAPPAAAPAATAEPPAAAPEPEPAQAAAAPSGEGDSVNGGRAKASPVARRIAREQGIDLSGLQGTGPGGRIVKADVEAAASGTAPQAATPAQAAPAPAEAPAAPAEAPAAEPQAAPAAAAPPPPASIAETGTAKGDVSVQELSRTQQVIARRMAESKATVPEFTIATDVDMEGAVELRKQLKAAAEAVSGAVPSYNDMVVKASALALREFPARTAPTRTAASSSTRASTSGSPSPPTTRSWCRPCSTPTASRWARSRATRGPWPSGCGPAPSPRPSSPAAPSRSRTSGCSA